MASAHAQSGSIWRMKLPLDKIAIAAICVVGAACLLIAIYLSVTGE
jgi:hypothetical protein